MRRRAWACCRTRWGTFDLLSFNVTEFSDLTLEIPLLNKLLRLGIDEEIGYSRECPIESILPSKARATDKTANNYENNGKTSQACRPHNPIAPYPPEMGLFSNALLLQEME